MERKNKGITLISLVITIIVMLILVAVTISMAVNGGLFEYAGKAVGDTQNALNQEQELANGKIVIGGKTYASIDDYLNNNPIIEAADTRVYQYTEIEGGIRITGVTADGIYMDKMMEALSNEFPNTDIEGVMNGSVTVSEEEMAAMQSFISGLENDEAFSNKVEEAYLQALKNCGNIPSEIDGKKVIEIGNDALSKNKTSGYITGKVVIPDTVVSIGGSAFWGNQITEVIIPNSVTYIGVGAFSGNQITHVTIPSSVTSIGNSAFGFNPLESVILEGTPTVEHGTNEDFKGVFCNEIAEQLPANSIKVPAGTIESFKSNAGEDWGVSEDCFYE